MTDSNWEEERKLAERYAQMEEPELQALAEHGYELTEVARQVLQTEIRQRGLDFKLSVTPAAAVEESEDAINSPLMTLQFVTEMPEAHRLQSILDDAGIPYCWGPHNLGDIDAFGSILTEGLALKVSRYDAARASQAITDSSPPEPEEPDYTPVCPKCHSPEIVLMRRESDPEMTPKDDEKFNWSCDACGNQWTDDGIEEEMPANQ